MTLASLKSNLVNFTIAFFLARAIIRIVSMFFTGTINLGEGVVPAAILAQLALVFLAQGVVTAIIFCRLYKAKIDWVLAGMLGAAYTATLPFIYFGLSGTIDPRFMLLGLLLAFVGGLIVTSIRFPGRGIQSQAEGTGDQNEQV